MICYTMIFRHNSHNGKVRTDLEDSNWFIFSLTARTI